MHFSETAYVSSRYLLDEVGCYDFAIVNNNYGLYTMMHNSSLNNLDLAIDTCKKDLQMYIGVGPDTRQVKIY